MKTSGIPNSLRRVFRWLDPPAVMAVTAMFAATQLNAMAQINGAALTNRADGNAGPAPQNFPTVAEQARAFEQATEKIRDDCIEGRRIICGRIVKILADGLVVESGYTNLMRAPLDKSWLKATSRDASATGWCFSQPCPNRARPNPISMITWL